MLKKMSSDLLHKFHCNLFASIKKGVTISLYFIVFHTIRLNRKTFLLFTLKDMLEEEKHESNVLHHFELDTNCHFCYNFYF